MRLLEDQLGSRRVADPHLAFVAPDPEARRLAAHHERGDPVAAARSVDGGEDDVDVRLAGVGDPDLGAGQRIAVAGPPRGERQGGRIGA